MKLPNGYGSVTKLSGNRRKPYIARVTLGWITDEHTGKTIQNASLTLAELYEKWTAAYFPTLENDSSCRTIRSAWNYCHEIAGMRVKDLRARHIKGIIDDGYIISSRRKNKGEKVLASAGTKARIKSMFNLMLDYALEYELIDKNYARTFDLSDDIVKEKEETKRGHIIFNDEENFCGIMLEPFAL